MGPREPRPDDIIVIATVDAAADVVEDMVDHARIGIERFADCDGYVGGTLHRSGDGSRLVQLLRWRSTKAYEACRDDPRWDDLPTTAPFLARVSDRSARLDVRIYEIVATAPE